MPVRIITPSRVVIILATAISFSLVNLIVFSVVTNKDFGAPDDITLAKLLADMVQQDDPKLVHWVKNMIIPPSKFKYNLNNYFSGIPENNNNLFSPSQEFILSKVEEILGNKLDNEGIFLEAGAFDGEYLSNTLSLEKNFGWRGVLVEAHPESFKKLLTKNRKSWAINACLNTHPWPSKELFAEGGKPINYTADETDVAIQINTNFGKTGLKNIVGKFYNSTIIGKKFYVTCVPLYTIMKALGLFHIDFLSLDVEGAELSILRTLPWDKVSFTIMAIELLDYQAIDELRQFLDSKGYVHVESFKIDHIFFNKNYVDKIVKNVRPLI